MNTYTSHSLEETAKIAHDFLKEVSEKYVDTNEAIIVGLSGHLGAGKTAFVQMIAKELGVGEAVTSPSFVIMKIYELGTNSTISWKWKRLIHIDAYRLERPEELDVLDFEKLASDLHNLILVEWPENVELEKLGESMHISFESVNETHVIKF